MTDLAAKKAFEELQSEMLDFLADRAERNPALASLI